MYDAVSIAVKAALWNTTVPLVRSVCVDGNTIELDVSNELHDCERLNMKTAPVMVTMCKIGEQYVVDPSAAEEQCSVGAVVVAVSSGKFSTVLQTGTSSLQPSSLMQSLHMAQTVAQRLDEALFDILQTVEPNHDVGFLK